MAVLGVVWVDLQQNGLGLPSFAAQPFGKSTVLGETLSRAERCANVDRWIVLCPQEQIATVQSLTGADRKVQPARAVAPPWQAIIRQSRKWSLHGWRGGLNRTSVLDEEFRANDFVRLLKENGADWLVHLRAESPLLDPAMLDAMAARAVAFDPPPPLVYGAIPPGLAGCVYRKDFLEELAQRNLFPGIILGYRAWEPAIELPEQPFAYRPSAAVSSIPLRLLADNARSLSLMRRLSESGDGDAETIAARLQNDPESLVPQAPTEIEVELTGRQGSRPNYLPSVRRGDMPLETLEALVAEYAAASDTALVTLAGHGDPLSHPQWEAAVQSASRAGIYGLAMSVDAISMTPRNAERLLQSPIDVVLARLDAHGPQTYRKFQENGDYAAARQNIETYLQKREQTGGSGPRLVVSIVRRRETLAELEGFCDHWSAVADGAVVQPYSDFAKRRPADDLLTLSPPTRRACRRLAQRLVIHSDGAIVTCSEDFDGKQTVGDLPQTSLIDAWQTAFPKLRNTHRRSGWSELPVCADCEAWDR